MSLALLQTRSLAIGYAGSPKRLFENLHLALPAGKLVCFMGPNGIGKSTLIRTLAGLHPPLGGTITWGDARTPADRHHHIAVVLTEKISAMYMTVRELVTFGRYPYMDWSVRLREEDTALIDDALRRIRIADLAEKKLHELSDGQLQMAMIARALAQDTPVMLLDEPTAHLDLNNRVEMMKLLRTLARTTKKAILVSTHELDLALQMADNIWLAGKDRNIIEGIPEDLVLNGAFDEIFEFKGFDLKTGKVLHETYHEKIIQLTGEGPSYWWTKNALERNGFGVTGEPGVWAVDITENTRWRVRKENNQQTFNTLQDVLQFLFSA